MSPACGIEKWKHALVFYSVTVTLKWWDDLWLNEGFASYMEYKAVSVVHPDWSMEDQFLSQDMIDVMTLDGKMSSHPIIQPVSHPDQITEIFDLISYNKVNPSPSMNFEYLLCFTYTVRLQCLFIPSRAPQ
jgi:glutamyl aminopeptidase